MSEKLAVQSRHETIEPAVHQNGARGVNKYEKVVASQTVVVMRAEMIEPAITKFKRVV